MSPDEKERQTISYYEQNAQEWTTSHNLRFFWEPEMVQFHNFLPQGKILEIGCGPGKEAKHLIDKGYTYFGVDAASSMINIAKKTNPRGSFFCQNLLKLNFEAGSFDGFWCAAVLLHIPREKIDQALEGIKKVIKPGGIGFISVIVGEGERLDEQTGRWFTLYSESEFLQIVEKNGFEVIKMGVRSSEAYSGEKQVVRWITSFVKAGR